MANVIYDPGMKDSMQDVAGILQAIGLAEQKRRQRTAAESIVMAIAGGDDRQIQQAIGQAMQSQTDYAGGIQGLLQRLGGAFMPQHPGMAAVSEAMPMWQGRADIDQTRARQQYYEQGGGMTDWERTLAGLTPEEQQMAKRRKAGLPTRTQGQRSPTESAAAEAAKESTATGAKLAARKMAGRGKGTVSDYVEAARRKGATEADIQNLLLIFNSGDEERIRQAKARIDQGN